MVVVVTNLSKAIVAAFRTFVFLFEVLPTLPSRPFNFITPTPVVQKLVYPTPKGWAEGDVYRPASPGRHPGIVVCLGVVPFGVEHPQVPRLGEALARSGFAALLYWSPNMRDFRLDPDDIEGIALAFGSLTEEPFVDENRSGLLGTCVGGSFALMAASSERIRTGVDFVAAFAPYGSLSSLARDIGSSTSLRDGERYPWAVDPLTRKVFVHSITALLEASEAAALRDAFERGESKVSADGWSKDAQAISALLAASDSDGAERAIESLPENLRESLAILSPVNYLSDIRAQLIAISHDRDDLVIPVEESRLLRTQLQGRAGLRYTEFAMFQHADPTKRRLSPPRLLWQLSKFYFWLYAIFRRAMR